VRPADTLFSAPLFGGAGPRWFTIAAHRPFLDDLAHALDAAFGGGGPEALAEAVVFTPTRRAARALAEAFVRTAGGRAVLLPQIRALGDLDEGEPPFEPGELALDLPPAISPLRRRFELARLVAAHAHLFERPLDASGALELADALASFLDSVQIEEVADPARVETLVEGDLAKHWRRSADFLAIATKAWPARLAELGLLDVNARRIALLRALSEQWRTKPPQRPLVVAGITNAAPAMAALLQAAAEAPRGCVVLPGLDLDLAEDAWRQVSDAHPQDGLKRLLAQAGVAREDVRPWPSPESLAEASRARARRRVVNEALRPADATADWLNTIAKLRAQGQRDGVDPIAQGLEGLSLVAARAEDETAEVCALLLRETLETPGRTAALITPDTALGRRVSAHLARWDVAVDSSAGASLAELSVGVLVGLVARAVAEPLEPATLLAIAKHPRVRLGLEPDVLARARRRLERRGLRGARPKSWDELAARLAPRPQEDAAEVAPQAEEALAMLQALRGALEHALAPFQVGYAPAAAAGRALAEALERLAHDARERTGELWAGSDGESAAELLAGLMQEGDALPDCTPAAFAQVMRSLLTAQAVRAGGATHPRLRILGLIEARLIGADRLILAGLEEGVWPKPAETDPLLSRPMRAQLGLPSPERRIGSAAHDFAQAACAREVVLVTGERRGGQPAVMSRWLWRLRTLAKGAGLDLPRRDEAVTWARALAAPPAEPPPSLRPAVRPAPRPPLEARPTQFSVTEVEKLVRDPYAVYARKILGLRQIERPDERIEARARGTAIHTAFERFAEAWGRFDGEEPGEVFARLYMQALRDQGAPDSLLAREQVLAGRAGQWVAELERERRGAARDILVEREGRIRVGDTVLTARADRIELTGRGAHVLDFKTGRVPTDKEVRTDFAPQLTLTAAILMNGGFEGLGAATPGDLVYLQVNGRRPPGKAEVRVAAVEAEAAATAALAGFEQLMRRYADPDTPYVSRIAPRFVAEQVSDFDHLARVREWSAADEEGEE
jgi:ATP-dependent helicase/nuclease subunit B